jgi:hypothetical protein
LTTVDSLLKIDTSFLGTHETLLEAIQCHVENGTCPHRK